MFVHMIPMLGGGVDIHVGGGGGGGLLQIPYQLPFTLCRDLNVHCHRDPS